MTINRIETETYQRHHALKQLFHISETNEIAANTKILRSDLTLYPKFLFRVELNILLLLKSKKFARGAAVRSQVLAFYMYPALFASNFYKKLVVSLYDIRDLQLCCKLDLALLFQDSLDFTDINQRQLT